MGGPCPDWIDGRNARVLKVSNEREKCRLLKTTRALEHLNTRNEQSRRLEKYKIEKNLEKLKTISTQKILTNLRKLPDKVSKILPSEDRRQVSVKPSSDTLRSQFGDHLPKFASYLQSSPKRTAQSTLKSSLPFSRLSLPINTPASRNMDSPNKNTISMPGSVNLNKLSKYSTSYSRSSQIPSGIGSRGTVTRMPSLSKVLSSAGSKPLIESRETIYGFLSFDKKLNEMLAKVTNEDVKGQSTSTETLKPAEVLRCRYLRLSQNNISTLLKQCEESGLQVDIHPHMQESEVNVDGVFSRSYSSDIL
ncbi:uncharacterized protein [Scyliorhinus torazame]|uniref:uncharacterized protein n=1 Tax=Scyliorhinus torazame TaxID=75743 RepID=UPI003B5B0160